MFAKAIVHQSGLANLAFGHFFSAVHGIEHFLFVSFLIGHHSVIVGGCCRVVERHIGRIFVALCILAGLLLVDRVVIVGVFLLSALVIIAQRWYYAIVVGRRRFVAVGHVVPWRCLLLKSTTIAVEVVRSVCV